MYTIYIYISNGSGTNKNKKETVEIQQTNGPTTTKRSEPSPTR
jgi:hypothetical protein